MLMSGQAEIVLGEDLCVASETDLSHLKNHKQHSARGSPGLGMTKLLHASCSFNLPILPAKDLGPVTAAPMALLSAKYYTLGLFSPYRCTPSGISTTALFVHIWIYLPIISLVSLSRHLTLTFAVFLSRNV